MHWEPDVGFNPGSPGSRPGPKAGAKPLHYPGIPLFGFRLRLTLPFFIVLGKERGKPGICNGIGGLGVAGK